MHHVIFFFFKYKEIDSGYDERFALRASSASSPKGETFVVTTIYFLVLNIVLSKSTRVLTTFFFK